jgi:hypothetical protein
MCKKSVIEAFKKDYKVKARKKGFYTIFEPRKNGKLSDPPFILIEKKSYLKLVTCGT